MAVLNQGVYYQVTIFCLASNHGFYFSWLAVASIYQTANSGLSLQLQFYLVTFIIYRRLPLSLPLLSR